MLEDVVFNWVMENKIEPFDFGSRQEALRAVTTLKKASLREADASLRITLLMLVNAILRSVSRGAYDLKKIPQKEACFGENKANLEQKSAKRLLK